MKTTFFPEKRNVRRRDNIGALTLSLSPPENFCRRRGKLVLQNKDRKIGQSTKRVFKAEPEDLGRLVFSIFAFLCRFCGHVVRYARKNTNSSGHRNNS